MEILAAYDLTGSLRATANLPVARITLSPGMSPPVMPGGRSLSRLFGVGSRMRSCRRSRNGSRHPRAGSALVVDDVETLLPELRQVVQRAFPHLWGVALPPPKRGDDAQPRCRLRQDRYGGWRIACLSDSGRPRTGSTTQMCPPFATASQRGSQLGSAVCWWCWGSRPWVSLLLRRGPPWLARRRRAASTASFPQLMVPPADSGAAEPSVHGHQRTPRQVRSPGGVVSIF